MALSRELSKAPFKEVMLCSIGQFIEQHGIEAFKVAIGGLSKEELWAVFSHAWRYMEDHEAQPPGAAKKRIGKRTAHGLFGTKPGTWANNFCKALVQAGKIGLSRFDVRHAEWNPKKYHFNDTMWRLERECLARYEEDGQRMLVTDLGMKEAKRLPDDEW